MVRYETGTPTKSGVYACRVPFTGILYQDEFLLWWNNEWNYLGSDQKYRDEVIDWIGPLERLHK